MILVVLIHSLFYKLWYNLIFLFWMIVWAMLCFYQFIHTSGQITVETNAFILTLALLINCGEELNWSMKIEILRTLNSWIILWYIFYSKAAKLITVHPSYFLSPSSILISLFSSSHFSFSASVNGWTILRYVTLPVLPLQFSSLLSFSSIIYSSFQNPKFLAF